MTKQSHSFGSYSDLSLLEYEEDPEFLEWYSTEGSVRIKELSTQLRSFLNYKYHIILLRFSKSKELNNIPKREKYEQAKARFTSLCSEYLTLMQELQLKRTGLEEQLLIMTEKIKLHPNEATLNKLKEMKRLGMEIWLIINSLSKFEIHHDSRLLNIVIRFASLLCDTHSAFSSLFSRFYRELRLSFEQLETELSALLEYNEGHQAKERKKEKRVKLLE